MSLDDSIKKILKDDEKVKLFGERSLEIIRKEVNIHSVLREYNVAFQYVLQQ